MQEERFEDFAASITGIYRDIQKLKAARSPLLGIKPVHVFWIYLLHRHAQGLSASQLAQASQSTRALVSREIEELERLGYISTEEKPGKRRYGWKFTLTQQGEAAAQTISQIALHIQKEADSGIPPEDLKVFYRTLRTLQQNFHRLTAKELDGQTEQPLFNQPAAKEEA